VFRGFPVLVALHPARSRAAAGPRVGRVADVRDRRPDAHENCTALPLVAVPDEAVDDLDSSLEAAEEAPEAAGRTRTDAEVFAYILKAVLWDAMERLVTLTDAELDKAILDAGFDPAKERSTPRSLRDEVVDAIAHKTLEADPSV
jgi:hypothetical protein